MSMLLVEEALGMRRQVNVLLCFWVSSAAASFYLRALATEEYAIWISSSTGQVEENSSRAYAAFRYLQRLVRDSGMVKLLYFRHTTCKERRINEHGVNLVIYSSQRSHAAHRTDYLHYVQLRQQVAVSQSKLLAVQEGAGRGSDLIGAILVNLVRKRRAEEVVQLLQGLQQPFL